MCVQFQMSRWNAHNYDLNFRLLEHFDRFAALLDYSLLTTFLDN